MEFGEEIMFNTNQVETSTVPDTFADGLVLDPHQLFLASIEPLIDSKIVPVPIILLKLAVVVP